MADEFLLKKIRERSMKGDPPEAIRKSFSKVYPTADIDLAFEEYENEKAREELEISNHPHTGFQRFMGNPVLWILQFLFTNPLPTFIVLMFLFYLLFKTSIGGMALSSETYVYYMIIHALVFFGVVTIQSKTMQWLANYSQDFGSSKNEFLKGIQLQLLNFAIILGYFRMQAAEPMLVIVLYVVLAIFFMVVSISLLYRILLMKAMTYLVLFEMISFVLWAIAYTLRKMFFV
jgi:hypothetical protein